jgi:hypothetical protein
MRALKRAARFLLAPSFRRTQTTDVTRGSGQYVAGAFGRALRCGWFVCG